METLSQPGRDMSYLLMHGQQNPDFDPDQCHEWRAWWSQPIDAAWGAMFPSRTQLRKLDARHLGYAQIGLHFKRDAARNNAPLLDRGVLHRISGTRWTQGLRSCLAKLENVETARAKHLWLSAICNANEHGNTQNARILLNWASAQNRKTWLSTEACAQTLLLFSDRLNLTVHDVEIENLFRLTDTSSVENEKAIWSTIVSSEHHEVAARALSAWCRFNPGIWDRMHRLALEDRAVPNAWLLACVQAKAEGFEDPLWQVASSSQDRSVWMKRLDWGVDASISPLGQWWAHQLNAAEERGGHVMPGHDLVSEALRGLGAPEPGSDEEMSLGGVGFACGLTGAQVDPSWFSVHPEWLLNCQGIPISRSRSVSSLDTWIKCGFDPAEVDANGNMAIIHFLSRNLSKKRKDTVKWLKVKYEERALPSHGPCVDKTLIDRLSALNDEDLMKAWLDARMSDPVAPLPSETENLAYMSTAPVVQAWCLRVKALFQWSEAHHHALWRGVIRQDRSCDAEIWDELTHDFPFLEDPNSPAWVICIKEAEDFAHDYNDLKRTLSFVIESGGLSISAISPVWQQNDFVSRWHVCINMEGSDASIAPDDADVEWWALRLSEWFANSPKSVLRKDKEMEGWLRIGLPLEGPVLDVLHARYMRENNQDAADAWFCERRVASALSVRILSGQTPSPAQINCRPRRF